MAGVSHIKWHLPHSIHGDHRGRTHKSPIANHRVEWDYAKLCAVRIAIDKSGTLSECPIEFEVIQEVPAASPALSSGPGMGGGTTTSIAASGGPTQTHHQLANGPSEKIVLGTLRLNLSEYVEESDALLRTGPGFLAPLQRTSTVTGAARPASSAGNPPASSSGHSVGREVSTPSGHTRNRSGASNLTTATSASSGGATTFGGSIGAGVGDDAISLGDSLGPKLVEDGVVRRYLMQDSKINSTLRVGILMLQIEGERNFVAPPLRTAPVFGGIAGFVPGAMGSTSTMDVGAGGAGGAIATDAPEPDDDGREFLSFMHSMASYPFHDHGSLIQTTRNLLFIKISRRHRRPGYVPPGSRRVVGLARQRAGTR